MQSIPRGKIPEGKQKGKTKVKKQLVFIFTALLFLAICCTLTYCEPDVTDLHNQSVKIDKAPNIYFSETAFDFGFVYQGEKVEHIFKFKNIGDTGLTIDKVRASCGCTAAVISDTYIPPSGEGEIKATFNTAGYIGRQSQSIYVQTNDPLNPTIVLQVKGEVKIEIKVSPHSIQFGDIPPHTSAVSRIEIIQKGEQALIIDKIKTHSNYIKIDKVEKRIHQGKNIYSLDVSLTPKTPAGRFFDRLEVYTNLERKPLILIGAQGRILGDIMLSPERIIFKTVPGEKKVSSVTISSEDDDFEIRKVESTIKYLSVELIPIETFKKYRIDLNIDTKIPVGLIDGEIIVYTNRPRETELRIPVLGQIIKPALSDTFTGLQGSASTQTQTRSNEIQIGYFFERGCLDCEHVHSLLQSLQEEFPSITIEEYDIGVRENMGLNEALCEIYGIPEEKRLITPTIFVGKDYLIGKGITRQKIIELTNKYPKGASLPLEEAAKSADVAESSIADRFQHFGIFAIIAAGLLDGVNPCAFATIIFFISYLTILKRKGREIVIVGIAFTSAIFITYFLIGIGLLEFLKYLTFLKHFTKFLYVLVAALTFLLGILSFWDFLKSRKGKATESVLQLPRFLKNKIHSTIKEQANLRRYVLAAFITGFIVSILEMACTGQVYLPTIVYATGISDLRFAAYISLLLYNIMFITPLIVIFILAYFGATAIDLSDTLGKNMALIKLLLSILFFIFTAFLVMLLI